MKTVKPGFNESNWTLEVECKTSGWGRHGYNSNCGCGATLEVQKSDLYIIHLHDNGGARDKVALTCHECRTEISLGNVEQFNFKEPLPRKPKK